MKVRKLAYTMTGVLVLSALCACATATAPRDQELTVGLVQKEIRVGMAQAEVAEALGSPNIVSKDAEGHEAWIYDKMATEASTRSSGGGGSILVLAYSRSEAVSRTSQKTLTVVIKFGQDSRVASFSYHASSF